MPSLYQSLLEDPRIEFATSSDQGQRLAQLQRTFQQAGLTKTPAQGQGKPLQAAADPSKGPFSGMGLGQSPFQVPIGGPGGGRGKTQPAPVAPAPAPQASPLGSLEAQDGQDSSGGLDQFNRDQKDKAAVAKKKSQDEDWDAQIARIEAQYARDKASQPQPAPRAAAMTPTQGPDTGAIDPNAAGAPAAPNAAAFFKAMTPHALRVAAATGVNPKLVLAQAALETGYGQHAPNNNLFGIKGPGPSQQTWEDGPNGPYQTTATFKAYKSPGESFDDYGRLLQNNSIYAPVLAAKTLPDQIGAMAKSGYATDRDYGSKLAGIVGQIPDLDTTDSANMPTVNAQNAMARGGFLNRMK